jgi:DNA-binding transcriptional regulator YhcF (GntR family)
VPRKELNHLKSRKGILAYRLSVKPETFSRVIRNLSERGVIEVHASHFTVLDRKALAEDAALASAPEVSEDVCTTLPGES